MPLFVIETIDTTDDTPQPEPQGAQSLGHAAGVRWYKAATIPQSGRAPTSDELAKAHLELPAMRQLKATARRKIENEMGDLHDLLADQAKQIEALTALVSRMAAEYLGGTTMSETAKATYLQRVEAVVGALDSGAITLRGDMEEAGEMIMRTLERSDRINEIVGNEYLPGRNEVLS